MKREREETKKKQILTKKNLLDEDNFVMLVGMVQYMHAFVVEELDSESKLIFMMVIKSQKKVQIQIFLRKP